jgi:hypothetical protein
MPPPRPKVGHHQPRVPENLVGLLQPCPSTPPIKVFRRNIKIIQAERARVGRPDAVLVFMLSRIESFCPGFDHKKGRPPRGVGKDGVQGGHAAVGDELLLAVQPIAFDTTFVVQDPVSPCLESLNI